MRLWTIHNWQLLKGPFTVRAFLACSQIQAMIIHYHTPYNDLLAKYTDESYPGKEPGEALSLRSLPTIQKSKFLKIINNEPVWLREAESAFLLLSTRLCKEVKAFLKN